MDAIAYGIGGVMLNLIFLITFAVIVVYAEELVNKYVK